MKMERRKREHQCARVKVANKGDHCFFIIIFRSWLKPQQSPLLTKLPPAHRSFLCFLVGVRPQRPNFWEREREKNIDFAHCALDTLIAISETWRQKVKKRGQLRERQWQWQQIWAAAASNVCQWVSKLSLRQVNRHLLQIGNYHHFFTLAKLSVYRISLINTPPMLMTSIDSTAAVFIIIKRSTRVMPLWLPAFGHHHHHHSYRKIDSKKEVVMEVVARGSIWKLEKCIIVQLLYNYCTFSLLT